MSLERLILFRHGKAEERAGSGRDFDRPLASRGRDDARETGRRLALAGFIPDLALVSPALRTLQTWEAAAPAFPETPLEQNHDLYNASAGLMLDLALAADAKAVILVGHNPGAHALAFELASRGVADRAMLQRLHDGFPPGAAAVFRFGPKGVTGEAVFYPADVRG